MVNGARRWLHVGVTRFQPSEIMKLALPLMLAWYFHKHEATLRLRDFAIAALLLVVPVALIARQPDLGTAALVGAAGFYVIFFAGLSLEASSIGLADRSAWSSAAVRSGAMLHDYQRKRVLTLLDPTTDPLGTGYHIIQSTIAIGSGGIVGQGLDERHADASGIHSRAHHRLHLRGVLRGVRPDRQCRAARALRRCSSAAAW